MNLSEETLKGLQDVNYSEPTDLQQAVIPPALEGKNLKIRAKAGMGKHGTFMIPALETLLKNKGESGTQVLILTPSVERAEKIDEMLWAMGYHAGLESAPIVMQGDKATQVEAVKSGTPVIVANPGQLQKLAKEEKIRFDQVKLAVIDELDQVHKIGILPIIEEMMELVPANCQRFTISSYYNKTLHEFAEKLMGDDVPYIDGTNLGGSQDQKPQRDRKEDSTKDKTKQPEQKQDSSEGSKEQAKKETAESDVTKPEEIPKRMPQPLSKDLRQEYIYVPPRMKISTLMAHLDETPDERVLIFFASKRGTNRIFKSLRRKNKMVRSLHQSLPDEVYAERIEGFKSGKYQFLLVADFSASQLDVANVNQVINYDVPNDVDEYRHRANLVRDGKATRIISLVSKQDRSDIDTIESELGVAPKEIPLPKEAQKKLEERKKNGGKKKRKRGKRGRGKRKSSRDDRSGRKKREKKEKKTNKWGLPEPSYDKLSGGKEKKKKEESKGFFGKLKDLFS
jgi:superfamily II DNA/RNA helicase